MEEIIVDDKVTTTNINDSNDKQADTSGSFFVGQDLQNLLNLFVRQSKENEELSEVNSVEISEVNIGESITLYSDGSMNGLLSQKPCAPPVPQDIVKMTMPLDFETETPGDDLLARLVTESVKDSPPAASDRENPASASKVGVTFPGREVVGHPRWVKDQYPEIYCQWEKVSGAAFFQGKVRMFCSRCRDNPSQGFLEGVPVCERCRLNQACSVCKLRVSSTFSYGLALCEADRQFLFRTFSQQPQFSRCETLCPITASQRCDYSRLRTCLTTKGFKFFVQASTQHLISNEVASERKRKYSGEGVYKELNFVSDAVPVDALELPTSKKHNTNVKSLSGETVFVKPPNSVIVRSTSRSSKKPRPSPRAPREPSTTKPADYYDGSRLGLSNKKKTPGLLNNPNSVSWVLQQQEKFLKYHMDLFYKRREEKLQSSLLQ